LHVDGRHAAEGRPSLHCLSWDGPCVRGRRGWREVQRRWVDGIENGTEHQRTRSESSRRGGGMPMVARRVCRI
jgi:hypothetical protein